MANIHVANSTANRQAVRRTRYESMETAFGVIKSSQYTVGDTLVFSAVPSREIIKVTLSSNGEGKEIFYGTDFSSAITFDIMKDGDEADIYYTISYVRGAGKIDDGVVQKGEGQLLKITIASSDPNPE